MEVGVDGRFYKAIQSLYDSPVACVKINDMYTDWFETPFGVKQGDILSPTLFALFVNDLALQIKKNNLESESDLQNMLNLVSSWCHKWRLVINKSKTQIMHFRNKGMERTEFLYVYSCSLNNNSEQLRIHLQS
uniref:Reverse transcriptase domain-containing protein n=1 Tax=Sparus aurata TaxID=8175 RepID=A0A671WXT4_SPAAU